MSTNDYTHPRVICQDGSCSVEAEEILIDKSATGRERPWRDKRISTEALVKIYREVNEKKADRLSQCGTWLDFVLTDGGKKLVSMDSCRVRLCPLCGWRRSIKIYSHTMQIVEQMPKYKFILLTLTVKNVPCYQLCAQIDDMMRGWQRLTQRKRFRAAVAGWYRGLEVTHNVNQKSPSFDTYHPHFHCLLAVSERYFKGDNYIKQEEWQQLWRSVMRLEYDPQVDVRTVKTSTPKAVAEVAKYACKESDYIIPEQIELSVSAVETLDKALENRRLVAYGGKMKEIHNALHLDDEVDGDLTNAEGDNGGIEDDAPHEFYFWHVGYHQYLKFF